MPAKPYENGQKELNEELLDDGQRALQLLTYIHTPKVPPEAEVPVPLEAVEGAMKILAQIRSLKDRANQATANPPLHQPPQRSTE